MISSKSLVQQVSYEYNHTHSQGDLPQIPLHVLQTTFTMAFLTTKMIERLGDQHLNNYHPKHMH